MGFLCSFLVNIDKRVYTMKKIVYILDLLLAGTGPGVSTRKRKVFLTGSKEFVTGLANLQYSAGDLQRNCK